MPNPLEPFGLKEKDIRTRANRNQRTLPPLNPDHRVYVMHSGPLKHSGPKWTQCVLRSSFATYAPPTRTLLWTRREIKALSFWDEPYLKVTGHCTRVTGKRGPKATERTTRPPRHKSRPLP